MTNRQADELIQQLKAINETLGKIAKALDPNSLPRWTISVPVLRMEQGYEEALRQAAQQRLFRPQPTGTEDSHP
jgi:hypothetical protein